MTTRGGSRPGAGRKASDERRQTITLRLLPETMKRLNEISERDGVSRGEIVDALVLGSSIL